MFRPFLQKIRNGFHVSTSRAVPALINRVDDQYDEEMKVSTPKEGAAAGKLGYFTVFAVQGKETQRFVIEVNNLTNPAFLNLLELAREEYGFKQQGALSLPCRPHELQKILEDWKADHHHHHHPADDHDHHRHHHAQDPWATCNATTVAK